MVKLNPSFRGAENAISLLKKLQLNENITAAEVIEVFASEEYRPMCEHHMIVKAGEITNLEPEDLLRVIDSIAKGARLDEDEDEKILKIRENIIKSVEQVENIEAALSTIKNNHLAELEKTINTYFPADFQGDFKVFFILDGYEDIYIHNGVLLVDIITLAGWKDIRQSLANCIFNFTLKGLVRHWSQDFNLDSYLLSTRLLSVLQLSGIFTFFFSSDDIGKPYGDGAEPLIFNLLVYFKDIEHMLVRILDSNLIEREWKKNFFILFYDSESGYSVGEEMAKVVIGNLGEKEFLESLSTPFGFLDVYNSSAKEINRSKKEYHYSFNDSVVERLLQLSSDRNE